MLFKYLYNWTRFKIIQPSRLFKNRLIVERDLKFYKIYSSTGNVFKNSKWSSYNNNNIDSSFPINSKTILRVFFTTLLLIYLFSNGSNYIYFYTNPISVLLWNSYDFFDYYTSYTIWLLTTYLNSPSFGDSTLAAIYFEAEQTKNLLNLSNIFNTTYPAPVNTLISCLYNTIYWYNLFSAFVDVNLYNFTGPTNTNCSQLSKNTWTLLNLPVVDTINYTSTSAYIQQVPGTELFDHSQLLKTDRWLYTYTPDTLNLYLSNSATLLNTNLTFNSYCDINTLDISKIFNSSIINDTTNWLAYRLNLLNSLSTTMYELTPSTSQPLTAALVEFYTTGDTFRNINSEVSSTSNYVVSTSHPIFEILDIGEIKLTDIMFTASKLSE